MRSKLARSVSFTFPVTLLATCALCAACTPLATSSESSSRAPAAAAPSAAHAPDSSARNPQATNASAAGVPTFAPLASRAAADVGPPSGSDPAWQRYQLLRRLDARIDTASAQSRLDLRMALDAAYPMPYLGVDAGPSERGLAILAVYADTGAEAAGVRKGDTLLSMSGRELHSKAQLARAVRTHRVGDVVRLELERAGAPLSLDVTIRPRPEEDEDFEEQFADLFGAPIPVPAPLRFDFEAAELDVLPAGFESWLGGHGRFGDWRVKATDSGRVVRQTDADTTGVRFPLLVAADFDAADVVARVRFRFVTGRIDRCAGLAVRVRDQHNYIVARANQGEADLRIFRVVHGDRRTLPGAIAAAPLDDERWHELEVRADHERITAVLDGKITAVGYDTFLERGRVGLWTKADSVTEFDELDAQATR